MKNEVRFLLKGLVLMATARLWAHHSLLRSLTLTSESHSKV